MKGEFPKAYPFREVEKKWYTFWKEKGFFRADPQKVLSGERRPFVVMMPPPNVTGIIHMGHVLDNTLQDLFVRFARMRGYETLWQPGLDHAGIATQNVVERQLAREGKTRKDLGREAFLKRVWAWKEQYGGRILEQLQRLGISPDWDRLVFTMDPRYSRAVRKAFVELYRRGLIYRGFRLIHWCPRCGTALADDEVEREERQGKLYVLRYPLVDGEGEVQVATTRPETYLGDTAVAVHPEDERYRHLVGRKVRLPLVNWVRRTPDGKEVPPEIPIIADPRVDPEFGTGAVKVTPAHDYTDDEIARDHGLPYVVILDFSARTTENAGDFKDLDRFAARARVVDALREAGYLVAEKPHTLQIGVCYRCKTVVEPMLSHQWFVKMKPLAEPALRAVVEEGAIRLIPENFVNLYRHWLENVRDWCISRQIWWGHRIPAYYCEEGHITVSEEPPARCETCGSRNLRQDEDVLDTWFSSWLWPFATLGWPDETPELKAFYPTTLLVTGWDILFFWVARMIMAGYAFTGKPPFRNVYLHGLVRDEKRRKLSKSLGNSPDPLDLFDRFSADGVRAGMAMIAPEGQDVLFSEKRMEQGRNFANKVWNASRLLLTQTPDGFVPRSLDAVNPALEDRWMLTRLSRALSDITEDLEQFDYVHAVEGMYHLFWGEFCDWYLEAIKERLRDPDRRDEALSVSLRILEMLLRMLHPLMPFVTEELWQRLPAGLREGESIMVAPWPELSFEDPEAFEQFEFLREWVIRIREVRSTFRVPRNRTVRVHLKLPEGAPYENLLRETASLWGRLAFGAELATTESPVPGSAVQMVRSIPVYVELGGVVDLDRERARLQKELQELERVMAGFQKRLSSEAFLKSAPPDVVARQRETFRELRARSEILRSVLESLRVGKEGTS